MFYGSIVALITPMNEDGTINYQELRDLTEWHIKSGTNGIVAMGTTAESCTLDWEEHVEVVRVVAETVNGRVPVIAGNGSNSTKEAVLATRELDKMNIDGFLTVTPYYNKPSQLGLELHYQAIAAETDKPVLLYNVPGRTGCDLLPETVAKLAQIKNIIGIKEATGDLARVHAIQSLAGADFVQLSGDDETALDFTKLGGKGVISVTANIAPEKMAQIYALATEKRFEEADKLNEELMGLHQNLFVQPNPVPCKWVLKQLEKITSDNVRLPLVPLESSYESVVLQAMEQANLIK